MLYCQMYWRTRHGETHCLHLFKISNALCGSWATGRNPEKLGCTCSIVAGSCDFERAHSSSLAGCLCYVTYTEHGKLLADLSFFICCLRSRLSCLGLQTQPGEELESSKVSLSLVRGREVRWGSVNRCFLTAAQTTPQVFSSIFHVLFRAYLQGCQVELVDLYL